MIDIENYRGSRPIHVLIATPLGRGGMGGIDRLVDQMRVNEKLFASNGVKLSFGTTRGPGHLIFSPLYFGFFIGRILFLKVFKNLDVVHLNISVKGSTIRKLLLARIATALGLPYIVHLHGGWYPQYFSGASKLLKVKIKKAFTGSAKVVVLGTFWLNFAENVLNVPLKKIQIIPNATDGQIATIYRPQDRGDDVKILFLGQLSKRKGILQLIDALALLPRGLKWTATLAGNGDTDYIKSKVVALGLGERVSVPGWMHSESTVAALASADILVLPSFAENMPMSVIEAMAFGLAVIATPVGSVPDIIRHGETGLIVPIGQVRPLATALEQLIKKPQFRQQLGLAAKRFHHDNLSIEIFAKNLAQVWKKAATRTTNSF